MINKIARIVVQVATEIDMSLVPRPQGHHGYVVG